MKTTSLSFLLLTTLLMGACSKGKDQSQAINPDQLGENYFQKDELRTDKTLALRDERFQEIIARKNKLAAKVEAASVYFSSFEYQMVSNAEERSNPGIRNKLKQDAALEFTNRVQDIFRDIKPQKMGPLKQGLGQNDEMTFYALATAMHMKDKDESESLFSLMKTALKKDPAASRSSLEAHEEIFLESLNKEISLELIKARVDVLAAIALKDLNSNTKKNFFKKMEDIIFRNSLERMENVSYPMTTNDANNSNKNNINKALDSAVKAKQFLKSIGIEKELEKTIKRAFTNLDFTSDDDKSLDLQQEASKRYVEELLK